MGLLLRCAHEYERNILSRMGYNWPQTSIAVFLRSLARKHHVRFNRDHLCLSFGGEQFWLSSVHDVDPVIWEYQQSLDFFDAVTRNMVVYDVGAYHGFYSVLAKQAQDVYSFEMSSQNAATLQQNAHLNPDASITCINKAVWNQDNTTVNARVNAGSRSSIRKAGESVPTITLDTFASNHPDPDIVKIDVEGQGYRVLSGATQVLERNTPTVFIEYHTLNPNMDSYNPAESQVHPLLTDLGYTLSTLRRRESTIYASYTYPA